MNVDSILEAAARAGKSGETTLHPLSENFAYEHNAMLPVALDKIKRMLSRLETDGFASFAEA